MHLTNYEQIPGGFLLLTELWRLCFYSHLAPPPKPSIYLLASSVKYMWYTRTDVNCLSWLFAMTLRKPLHHDLLKQTTDNPKSPTLSTHCFVLPQTCQCLFCRLGAIFILVYFLFSKHSFGGSFWKGTKSLASFLTVSIPEEEDWILGL